jgi:hypothetical protein
VQLAISLLGCRRLERLTLAPARRHAQLLNSLGRLLHRSNRRPSLLAGLARVVRVGGHVFFVAVFLFRIARWHVADLNGPLLSPGSSGILARLLLFLALFAAQLAGGLRRRGSSLVGI